MCTDVVSVSISVINKINALLYTQCTSLQAGICCYVHTIISILYIPIHTHATTTCTWSPLNIILYSSLSSLFSPVVKFSCYMAPSQESVGRASDVIVYELLSLLLLITATVTVYSHTNIVWYIKTGPQTTSVHR